MIIPEISGNWRKNVSRLQTMAESETLSDDDEADKPVLERLTPREP